MPADQRFWPPACAQVPAPPCPCRAAGPDSRSSSRPCCRHSSRWRRACRCERPTRSLRRSPHRRPSRRRPILAWERSHDTLQGGNGSDVHGWRNALNYYGWGSSALWADQRVYDDVSFSSCDYAVKAAVRSMIRYRKPVAILAWAGQHAQMLTGYYGLVGDPLRAARTGSARTGSPSAVSTSSTRSNRRRWSTPGSPTRTSGRRPT